MSLPVVNASAEIERETLSAWGPSCTRTRPRSAPNACSIGPRTSGASGWPPPTAPWISDCVPGSSAPPS